MQRALRVLEDDVERADARVIAAGGQSLHQTRPRNSDQQQQQLDRGAVASGGGSGAAQAVAASQAGAGGHLAGGSVQKKRLRGRVVDVAEEERARR